MYHSYVSIHLLKNILATSKFLAIINKAVTNIHIGATMRTRTHAAFCVDVSTVLGMFSFVFFFLRLKMYFNKFMLHYSFLRKTSKVLGTNQTWYANKKCTA